MADFCKQCSIEHFGEDYGDLKLGDPGEGYEFHVLCEGCGVTGVDKDGSCNGRCLNKDHVEVK